MRETKGRGRKGGSGKRDTMVERGREKTGNKE